MERDQPGENPEHMPGDTQSSNDDLYVQDLPASLTQRISSIVVNDQPDDDTSAISPTANAQGGESEESLTRSESPPFERPAAWRAIDVGHFERLANERAAEAERAQSLKMTTIEASLHNRQVVINRATRGLDDFDGDWAVPPPWSHDRFQGDLSQHPYLLERYANQEMEIRALVNKRIKLLVSHTGVESLFKPSNDWKRFTKAVKSRTMTIEIDELDLHIGSLLAFKKDSLILSVEKGEVKLPGSWIVSELPPKLLDVTIRNEELYERFRKLWEYEKEHFPHLFLDREFPGFLKPWERSRVAPSPPVPAPSNPPESLVETLEEARDMLRTDSWLSQSEEAFFNQKPSITEQWIPIETREQIFQWPELKQQLEKLRNRELELFPGRFPSMPVGEDRPASSTDEAKEDSDDSGVMPTSSSSQHASISHKRMDDSTLFEGTSQNYTSNPSSVSQPSRNDDRTSPKQPSETLSLSSRPQSGPTGSSIQLSMQAPETKSTGSTFLSMPTSSVQRSSDVPPTPIRSPALSPPPVLTPVPSQADSSAPKASPIPASRLKYRLEVERRRSDDGTVQQMRFGGEDILPGKYAE